MIFKVCLLIASMTAWAMADLDYYHDDSQSHGHEIHAPQPYDFGYKVTDAHGNSQFRQENGNGDGGVTGSYGYTDKLGVYRKVVYVADKWGFRANIQTNEPGTANQSPADAVMDAKDPPYYVYYKPLQAQSSYHRGVGQYHHK